jgi:hypothetical protein
MVKAAHIVKSWQEYYVNERRIADKHLTLIMTIQIEPRAKILSELNSLKAAQTRFLDSIISEENCGI